MRSLCPPTLLPLPLLLLPAVVKISLTPQTDAASVPVCASADANKVEGGKQGNPSLPLGRKYTLPLLVPMLLCAKKDSTFPHFCSSAKCSLLTLLLQSPVKPLLLTLTLALLAPLFLNPGAPCGQVI